MIFQECHGCVPLALPAPTVFGQRVRNCLKTKELSFCSCKRVRRSVKRKNLNEKAASRRRDRMAFQNEKNTPHPGSGLRIRRACIVCFRGMDAKGVTPILNVSDIAASFAWFEKWAGGNAGTGERLRHSGPWDQANARSFFAWAAREGAAGGRMPPRLDRTETKRPTKAPGCPCG